MYARKKTNTEYVQKRVFKQKQAPECQAFACNPGLELLESWVMTSKLSSDIPKA